MLARYRRFRHILVPEQRNWPDRLVLPAGLIIPFTAGVVARLLFNYEAADTHPRRRVAGGPHRRPLHRRHSARHGAAGSVRRRIRALPFAVGCGFAGGGLREACPKEDIWSFSPFVFFSLPGHVWRMVRPPRSTGRWWLLVLPRARDHSSDRGRPVWRGRLFNLHGDTFWLSVAVYVATVLTVSTPIKIWNNARIEHRLQEQEKLLLNAKVEALKSQINPGLPCSTRSLTASPCKRASAWIAASSGVAP